MTNTVIMHRGMTQVSIPELLSEWPDRQAIYADAKAADQRLDIVAVHRWFQRGSVPVKYWRALIDGALRRGLNVSAERFLAAHAPMQATKSEAA